MLEHKHRKSYRNSSENEPLLSKENDPIQRWQVLNLLHADGFVQTFAPKYIDVRNIIVPAMKTAEGEAWAEYFIEQSLPPKFRNLYGMDCLRATGQCREIAPSDIAQVKAVREFFRALEDINARSAVAS